MNSKMFNLIIILSLAFIISGCTAKQVNNPVIENPLINETLNNNIENSINSNASSPGLNTNFSFTLHPDAKYDFGMHDIFTLEGENFDSTKYSVLGIKFGDNYSYVLSKLGIPDVMYVPADKSYKNMEYSRKIGIDSGVTAVTFNLKNDVVTQISMRQNFNLLKGNTSMGQDKAYLYAVLGTPDYQDFSSGYKVFHYVEKGLDIYMNSDSTKILSIMEPKKYLGVEYRNVLVEISEGVFANVTRTFLIEENKSE